MAKYETINVLLCLDDLKWDYTRHAAVTIISLLETNKTNKIKIYIMSSVIPKENIEELKRIVGLYNQEIEFIIRDDIVPEDLKKVIINKNQLTWWVRYRWFSPLFIKNVDRILSIDCDVLIMKDLKWIYNVDMKWKAIAWYYDLFPFRCKNKIFWIKEYINAGAVLIDFKNYNVKKINSTKMVEINEKYSKYFQWNDQDKINIIFDGDKYIYKKWINYQITNKYFTKWLDDAEIVHSLKKPYVQYANIPKKLVNLYNKYLDLTKWRGYPEKKAKYWYMKHIYITIRSFCFHLLISLLWDEFAWKLITFYRKLTKYY